MEDKYFDSQRHDKIHPIHVIDWGKSCRFHQIDGKNTNGMIQWYIDNGEQEIHPSYTEGITILTINTDEEGPTSSWAAFWTIREKVLQNT